jgi:hypothetical protein
MTTAVASKTIEQACRAFEKLNRISLGEDPLLAYDRCWEVSLAFSFYCCGMGLDASMLNVCEPLVQIRPVPGVQSQLDARLVGDSYAKWQCIGHTVVWFPKQKLFVDWTARQFWPNYGHPWIETKKTLEAHWAGVLWPSSR